MTESIFCLAVDELSKEGVAFTSSLLAARKELNSIKQCAENPFSVDDLSYNQDFQLNGVNAEIAVAAEFYNDFNGYEMHRPILDTLALNGQISGNLDLSSGEESDVYEVPMSSPDIVSIWKRYFSHDQDNILMKTHYI